MKILTTGDWHLGNMFHGNDRLVEHRHFFTWLLDLIEAEHPDALLVAGDVFDNANPSAAVQSAYYGFLADATHICPDMQIVITAGNHDSASRLEAPRALLSRYSVEVRGTVCRQWTQTDHGGEWVIDFDDLIIPLASRDDQRVAVLAVPFLRTDVVQNTGGYSAGVADFLRRLTARARKLYPEHTLVMMAHMYASGADIAASGHSEKILIGGQEEVNIDSWPDHPDYLTCGHIHKRQQIWRTQWARYTGSILPMSFAEARYHHGVDILTIDAPHRVTAGFVEYTPQHPLCVLPEGDELLSPSRLSKLIDNTLPDRIGGALSEKFVYLTLRVPFDKFSSDRIRQIEALVQKKDAVLCRIEKQMPQLDITTIDSATTVTSVDDILNRDPLDTLREAFVARHNTPMTARQQALLSDMLSSL